jgi:hypothetical protein
MVAPDFGEITGGIGHAAKPRPALAFLPCYGQSKIHGSDDPT